MKLFSVVLVLWAVRDLEWSLYSMSFFVFGRFLLFQLHASFCRSVLLVLRVCAQLFYRERIVVCSSLVPRFFVS